MNHSIYSADRATHLKIRGRGACRWYRRGGLRHFGSQDFERRISDRARHQGRQGGDVDECGYIYRSLMIL